MKDSPEIDPDGVPHFKGPAFEKNVEDACRHLQMAKDMREFKGKKKKEPRK